MIGCPLENWEAIEWAHKELTNAMLQAVSNNPDLDDDKPVKDENTPRTAFVEDFVLGLLFLDIH
jgi:hypothetical protein